LLAELMRQHPGFKVNKPAKGDGSTLLHSACLSDRRSPVIPLLLAHPDIDVNAKTNGGWTPFYYACCENTCVREMLKDSRVRVNDSDDDEFSPLWLAACQGHLDIIKWWIASGREMDLGEPGDVGKRDIIREAKRNGKTEIATLLERFKEKPDDTRNAVQVELGCLDEQTAEMFALVVFVSDGLLQIYNTTIPSSAARYFSIASQLPLELQMVLCYRVGGSSKEIIPGKESEFAFKELARRLW